MARFRVSGGIVWLKRLMDVVWYFSLVSFVLAVATLVYVSFVGENSFAEPQGLATYAAPLVFSWEVPLSIDAEDYAVFADGFEAVNPGLTNVRDSLRYGFHASRVVTFFTLLALGLPFWLLNLAIVYKLRAILITLTHKEPFVRANVNRVRFVGGSLVGLELLERSLRLFGERFVRHNFTLEGVTLPLSDGLSFTFMSQIGVEYNTLFAGLVLLVLAEIFRYAFELQLERDTLFEEHAFTA